MQIKIIQRERFKVKSIGREFLYFAMHKSSVGVEEMRGNLAGPRHSTDAHEGAFHLPCKWTRFARSIIASFRSI